MKKWTIENCSIVANQCVTKKEFKLNYPNQFRASYRRGWLESICTHMIKLGSKYKRLIYAFEFSDKSVYIGLTYNSKKRYNDHFKDSNGGVYKYIQQTGLQPEFKELTNYLDKNIASEKEGEYVKKYKNEGWKILNKRNTGGLGSNIRIWNFESCKLIAAKYNYRSELKKFHPSVYFTACKNGWLIDICKHMKYLQKPNWTLETCKIEALKYKTKSEFTKNSLGAYLKAQRNKWLDQICTHMN